MSGRGFFGRTPTQRRVALLVSAAALLAIVGLGAALL